MISLLLEDFNANERVYWFLFIFYWMLHPNLGDSFDVYDGQIKQISVKQINLMGESVEIWDVYANRSWFVSYAIVSEECES